MRRALPALCTAILGLLVIAPAAAADDFRRIYDDFRDDGRIEGCRHSAAELENAAERVPPDIDQYAPDFADQLDAARQAHAAGGCEEGAGGAEPDGAGGGSRGPGVGAPPAPDVPVREVLPASAPAPAVSVSEDPRGGGAPLPVWLLGALALVAGVGGGGWLAAWWFGWSPERWTRPLSAAASEAGGRTADLAGEFWDWVRLGR